jgi:hypothetical protein
MTENQSVCLDNYYIRKQSTNSSDVVSTEHNGLMTSTDKTKLNTLDPHPNNLPAYSLGLYKIATNTNGHVTNATAVTASDITALGITGGSGGETYLDVTDYYWDSVNEEIVLIYNLSSGSNNSGSGTNTSITIDSSWIANSSNPVESKIIKTALDNKIDKSNTVGLMKNDGTVDTNTYLTSHQSLSNYYTKAEIDALIGDIEEDMLS